MDLAMRAGLLGNTPMQWSYADWHALADLRVSFFYSTAFYSARLGQGRQCPWIYDCPAFSLTRRIEETGVPLSDVTVWLSPDPARHRLLQGELMESEHGWWFKYSLEDVKMREGMSRPKYAVGLAALGLIEHYADPGSVDMIRDLLAEYDGAVIEFSVFNGNVGRLPHKNTLIWEVRHY
jgi:hypothetical protein